MITVSVIIPYYGEREALARCLEALGRQSLGQEELEIIVVNNDPKGELSLETAGGRVTVIEESRPGSYAARNRGVEHARGDWLAFTDADCVPDARWLEVGLRQASRQGPVGGHIQITLANPHSLAERYDRAFGLNQKSYIENAGFAATANLIVSKSLFQKIGPFSADLRSGGDLEWCRRASRHGRPVTYCPEAIVFHPARASCRQLIRKAMRIQGGVYALDKDFGLELADGVARGLIDIVFPRLYIGKLDAMRKSGDDTWWRLYLLACLVNGFALAERCRLWLGGTALR